MGRDAGGVSSAMDLIIPRQTETYDLVPSFRFPADTLPVLAFFHFIFHVGFVVPMVIVIWGTESEQYVCNHKVEVRTAMYGILALYCVSALNELLIVVFGLRGGPFEEHRRRPVAPLLYIEVALWTITLGWTIFGTYVGTSPSIGPACWSDNPCSYLKSDLIPTVCTSGSHGDVVLTPPCLEIFRNTTVYTDQCFIGFFSYAATWAYNNYNASVTPPFNRPGSVPNPPNVCNNSISVFDPHLRDWINEHNLTAIVIDESTIQN